MPSIPAYACCKYLTFIMLVFLTACSVFDPQPEPLPSLPVAAKPYQVKQTFRSIIDTERSFLRLYVYRSGRLAHLGHNHVISAHELIGAITVHPDITQSSFSFTIPVTSLVVDAPEARKTAGVAFNTVPSAADIAGTRRNLLGKRLLAAKQYPTISVQSASINRATTGHPLQATDSTVPALLNVNLLIDIAGQQRTVKANTKVTVMDSMLVSRGELTLRLTDLGLTPFSILNGAIAVKDELVLHYQISAPIPASALVPL